jgi:hypothetical protein
MTTQLDFIVFGPGRSGTSVFGGSFNLHPKVFCAIEFLPVKADHSIFRMPDDMLRLHLGVMPHRTKSIEVLKEKLSHGEVDLYGNKMPNYYLKLDRLLEQLPNLKMFYIYRSPLEFVHSWDRRAGAENDKWHEGRVGIFGTLEQIFCLKRLAALSADVTMVSYRSLFFDDPHLMARVVGRLGVDPVEFDQAWFEKTTFGKKEPKSVEHEFYDKFFQQFRFDLVDAYFDANPLSRNTDSAFIDVVNEQFADLPSPKRFARFLQEMDPTVQEFAQTWRRQLRNQLDNHENPACDWLLKYSAQANRQIASAVPPVL